MAEESQPVALPSAGQIRQAARIYLAAAYGPSFPASLNAIIPAEDADVTEFLMGEHVERTPDADVFCEVRSFALRLGNRQYPHMKLRLSRPPNQKVYLFSVDAHDVFLKAPPDSPDFEALEEMKKYNAALVKTITGALAAAGLPTEKTFLREKIRQAKRRRQSGS